MKNKTLKDLLIGIIGGAIAGAAGCIIGSYYPQNKGDTAEIFQKEGLPRIIRTYALGRADNIFVEDPNDPNNNISFGKYLDSIKNKDDRDIEEAKINKIVGW